MRDANAWVNPFVHISLRYRVAIVLYVGLWQIVTPALSVAIHGPLTEGLPLYMLLSALVELIYVLPFFFRSYLGLSVGWLNPFVGLALFRIVWDIASNPLTLISPFVVWAGPVKNVGQHAMLPGWSESVIVGWAAYGQLLTVIALTSMLLTAYLVRPRLKIGEIEPKLLFNKVAAIILIVGISLVIFLEARGGVIGHISTFAMGRHRALEGLSHWMPLFSVAALSLMVYAVYRPQCFKSLPFYIAVAVVCALPFLLSGSRANIFITAAGFVYCYIFTHRRVPILPIAGVGIVAVMMIGVLGEIRFIGASEEQETPYELVKNLFTENAFRETVEDLEARRSRDSFVPTIARGPSEHGYLYGRTYLNSIAFFIPRAIWEEKPRSAGAHVAALIYGRHLGGVETYHGGGVPPGAIGEAYWNGGVVAVILVYSLFGAFLSTLGHVYKGSNGHAKWFAVFLILAILNLREPAAHVITPYIQTVVLYIFLLVVLKMGKKSSPSLKGWANQAVRFE